MIALINKPCKQENQYEHNTLKLFRVQSSAVLPTTLFQLNKLHQVGHRNSYSIIRHILQRSDIHKSDYLRLPNGGLVFGSILPEWSNFVDKIKETPPPSTFDMQKPLHRTNSHFE
jgi:hypothetical protein